MNKKILMVVAFLCWFGAQGQPKSTAQADLWAITNDYLKAFEEINFDKMGTFLHDSVTFFDINSRAVGKQSVIQNWKSTFNPIPEKIKFEIGEHFVSGNFVVVNLRYEAVMKMQNKNTIVNIDVITVVQFKNGKMILLHDYPDINAFNRQWVNQVGGQLIDQSGEINLNVIENFYKSYSNWDIPGMTSCYADNIEFKDLTAKEAFPRGVYEHSGKAKVSAFWSGIFGDIKLGYVDVKLNSAFSAGNFVIANSMFSMVLPTEWTGKDSGKVFISIPIKTLFQLKDGKIVTHYDFADYDSYNKQIQAQISKP